MYLFKLLAISIILFIAETVRVIQLKCDELWTFYMQFKLKFRPKYIFFLSVYILCLLLVFCGGNHCLLYLLGENAPAKYKSARKTNCEMAL